jgi:hypothetical protein
MFQEADEYPSAVATVSWEMDSTGTSTWPILVYQFASIRIMVICASNMLDPYTVFPYLIYIYIICIINIYIYLSLFIMLFKLKNTLRLYDITSCPYVLSLFLKKPLCPHYSSILNMVDFIPSHFINCLNFHFPCHVFKIPHFYLE